MPDPDRDKAVRLFTYLRELAQLRTRLTRDLSSYDRVVWFDEVPHEPGCFSISRDQPDEEGTWLRVRRGREPACPEPPWICADWVSLTDLQDDLREPQIRPRIPVVGQAVGEPARFIELSEAGQVQEKWLHYLINDWTPWAEKHRRWRSVQEIYKKLFDMHQQLRKLGESYELILGLGLLTWITPTNQAIRRHILVGRAALSFDPDRGEGEMTVLPDPNGVRLSLEQDMLEPTERPDSATSEDFEEQVQRLGEDPWSKDAIDRVLGGWVRTLRAEGDYRDSTRALAPSVTPTVAWAPALILRQRSSRSLVRALSRVSEQIELGGDIPVGVRRRCRIFDEPRSGPEAPPHGIGRAEDEVLFPLPWNEEQFRIARHLAQANGALVQGPPGTGKSHTIVNLIAHLLASGKRILVTSQTPRALKVLQEKFPEEMGALCVSVLGSDVRGLEDLKESVEGITEKRHGWNEDASRAQVIRLEAEIRELRKRKAEIALRLRESRERETYQHEVASGAHRGTAARIAERLVEAAPAHSWFTDQLQDTAEIPMPAAGFARLRSALCRLTPERRVELTRTVFPSSRLPSIEEFLSWIRNEEGASEGAAIYGQRAERPSVKAIRRAPHSYRERSAAALGRLELEITTVLRSLHSWVPSAISDVLSARSGRWEAINEACKKHLPGLAERASVADRYAIHNPSGVDRARLLADAKSLLSHLSSGGRLGWGPFRASSVKVCLYLTTDIRVNGKLCNDAPTLSQLILRVEVELALEYLWNVWNGTGQEVSTAMTLIQQVEVLKDLHATLKHVLSLRDVLKQAQDAVAGVPGLTPPAWHDEVQRADLQTDFAAAAALDALTAARKPFDDLLFEISAVVADPLAHAVNRNLAEGIKQRDKASWGVALREVKELESDKDLSERSGADLDALRRAAPNLASALEKDPGDPRWQGRLESIEKTWAWARGDYWLRGFLASHNEADLVIEASKLDRAIAKAVTELASTKAWIHCLGRLSAEEENALRAWTESVRRVGRGTGRFAEYWRRNAQANLEKCRGAIPGWIMPFYRVAETIDPQPCMFDVVIVDEASQSGPEALLLEYLAKQIVIVGDDQQISPDAVGIERDAVRALQGRYLDGIPNPELLDPESSLFLQGQLRFGSRIVLREHFRCMPEIIRFSNDLCYRSTPLLPLRQYPPKRFEPIKVSHIRQGFREGGSQAARNRPEAEALVDAICQCCQDPLYAGKSMGVISLQGEYQARLIQGMLQDRLDGNEIEEREIVCGDAYAFQGDERDVIFLSLVAAPNERIGALTNDAAKRRFNVAASRARDQLWLFHTATLNDLNPEDMRYKILSYCLDPRQELAGGPDWTKCESKFEERVGRLICERGYRVVVQYEPLGRGGKRIDLVVEGLKSRLAVECYGDHWHGPEEYDNDSLRIRQLERCQWRFWILWESAFYADKGCSMDPLWEILDEMQIYPVGKEPTVASDPIESVVPGANKTVLEEASLFERNGTIHDVDQEEVRAAISACLPSTEAVNREILLRQATRRLGLSKLGSNIRSRLNRAIGAEIRAGRLTKDGDCVVKTPSLFNEL